MGGFLQTGMRFRMSHGMCELRDRHAHKFTQSVFQSSVNDTNHLTASNSYFFSTTLSTVDFLKPEDSVGHTLLAKNCQFRPLHGRPHVSLANLKGWRSEITVRSVKILPDVPSNTLPRSSSSPVDCTAKPSSSITGPPGIWRWH